MNTTMKAIHFTRHAFLVLALALPLVASAQMANPNDRVRVVVSIKSANQIKDIKGSSADTVTQNKVLSIQLSGSPRIKDTRVVKWAAYGRDLKGHTLSTIGFGEIALALSSNGQQTVESKSISTTYTPEHSEVSKSGGRSSSRSRSKAKKVAAEGIRYVGYSVQVLDGGRVVGEASDPVGIKQEVAK
jgi:hypothetical protein